MKTSEYGTLNFGFVAGSESNSCETPVAKS